MISIPPNVSRQYKAFVKGNDIPLSKERYYFKWLRFYWDFCRKYGGKPEHEGNIGKFLDKLTEKNQSVNQRNQARHAIGLYYAMSKPVSGKCSASLPSPAQTNLDAEKYRPMYTHLTVLFTQQKGNRQ